MFFTKIILLHEEANVKILIWTSRVYKLQKND